jgi:hypothetical protein
MICPKCGNENPEDSQFCGKCWAPLGTGEWAPTEYDVKLVSAGANPQAVIAALTGVTGLLSDPEHLVSLAPCVILRSAPEQAAKDLAAKLELAGAQVDLVAKVSLAAMAEKAPQPEAPAPPAPQGPTPATSAQMDYGKAFSFFFEDKDWLKKMLLGGVFNLLAFVIVGAIINAGYYIRVMRNVRDGLEEILPDWENIGGFLSDGMAPWGITIIYSLPSLIPSLVANVLSTFGEVIKKDAGTAFSALSLCCSCVSFLGYAFLILAPAALVNYARTESFGAAFRFGELFKIIKKFPGPYVLTLLVSVALHILGGFGVIACCIGALATYFWSTCASYHLYGQLCRMVGEEI